MSMDIGIAKKERKLIADSLTRFLADTFVLYIKTLNYHWNVTGPYFKSLHDLFNELYDDLGKAGDSVAERIRALGFQTPASMNEFLRLTVVDEERTVREALDMVRQLTLDNELMVRRANEVYALAESFGDEPTADLMITRMSIHTQRAWMLRSHLEAN